MKQSKVKPDKLAIKDRKYVPVANRRTLYAHLAKYTPRAIFATAKLLKSPNHQVRLGAARLIMAKTMPDLQSMEIEGEVRQRVTVNVIKSYLQDVVDGEILTTNKTHSKELTTTRHKSSKK